LAASHIDLIEKSTVTWLLLCDTLFALRARTMARQPGVWRLARNPHQYVHTDRQEMHLTLQTSRRVVAKVIDCRYRNALERQQVRYGHRRWDMDGESSHPRPTKRPQGWWPAGSVMQHETQCLLI